MNKDMRKPKITGVTVAELARRYLAGEGDIGLGELREARVWGGPSVHREAFVAPRHRLPIVGE